jgi:regulator of replication initiation timing
MSNILKTIEYLKKKPEIRFLVLTNQENGQKIGKSENYLSDIPNEDLVSYIKNSLGPVAVNTHVWVELRVKRDNTSRKEGDCRVLIEAPKSQIPAVQQNLPVQQFPMQTQQPQVMQPTLYDSLPSGGNFGLGLPALMDLHTNSSRLKDKEEQFAELKEDYKDLKHENKQLDIENRELKTKLSTAEAKETMAVMLAKTENKSFFESPAFEKMMENAPQLLSGIAAMKGGAVPGALGAAASDIKNELFEFVNENVPDSDINFLGAIAGKLNSVAFKNELQILISRYATS